MVLWEGSISLTFLIYGEVFLNEKKNFLSKSGKIIQTTHYDWLFSSVSVPFTLNSIYFNLLKCSAATQINLLVIYTIQTGFVSHKLSTL